MEPKFSNHHDDGHFTSNLLPAAVISNEKSGETPSDALQVDDLITKASELDAMTVRNTFAWFLHTSVWIISGVSAVIAALYLLTE